MEVYVKKFFYLMCRSCDMPGENLDIAWFFQRFLLLSRIFKQYTHS